MLEQDYLQRAFECLQMAQKATNSVDQAALLDIAGKWLLLAGETPDTRAASDLLEALRTRPHNAANSN